MTAPERGTDARRGQHPTQNLDATTTASLHRARPVVVYCWDAL